MFNRIMTADSLQRDTCFLWGPRQSGKSTLLRRLLPKAPTYDLLLAQEYRRLSARPALFREECEALGWTGATQPWPIIVDEVQKLPDLLDEVHALISRRGLRFILTGSSPRKLLRGGGNLLGGRAVRRELFPLVSAETPQFELQRALEHGLLPPHYTSDDPTERLAAYVGDYLKEEILAEALTRNHPAFQVRGYFEVLVDTLVATWLPAWRKRPKRRVVESPRFYFFDVGLVNDLAKRRALEPGSAAFGDAFEHFVFMELHAHASYRGKHYPLAYWRTTSGFEVDFILGDAAIAIEAKSSDTITDDHLRGLRAWRDEHKSSRCVLVSRIPRARTVDGIEVLPLNVFLRRLWSGEFLPK